MKQSKYNANDVVLFYYDRLVYKTAVGTIYQIGTFYKVETKQTEWRYSIQPQDRSYYPFFTLEKDVIGLISPPDEVFKNILCPYY